VGAFEQDFIRRQISQLAEALRRLVGRARETGEIDPAMEAIAGTGTELLGVPWEILAQTDPASARMLIGAAKPDRIEAYAKLLDAEAELLELRGDAAGAAARKTRAAAIRGA
jgi:hypothetical protein